MSLSARDLLRGAASRFPHVVPRNLRRRLLWHPPRTGTTSQYGQDLIVAELIGRPRSGVFVDIGAHDGVSYSNTRYFERALGWTGVCVEPHPDAYERLTTNRTCQTQNVAVGGHNGEAELLTVVGQGEMLSSLEGAHADVDRITGHVKQQGNQATLKRFRVPCWTLDRVLEASGLDHVDYITIDTEGNEPDILREFSPQAYQVRVLTIENNSQGGVIEGLMRDKGYRLAGIVGCDEIYLRM